MNRLLAYVLILGAALGAAGCDDDLLTTVPTDQVSSGTFWTNERDFNTALSSFPAVLVAAMVLSAEKARLIELRFYGGLTESEAADAMGISRASATRQWRLVRAWLSRKLTGHEG